MLTIPDLARSLGLVAHTRHFIHIPKNAGVSVRKALQGKVAMTKAFHYRYRDVARPGMEYFAIVSNPWRRVVSRYTYAIQSAKNWPDSDPRKAYFTGLSFDRFVCELREFEIPQWPGKPWMGPHGYWGDQLDYVTDESGAIRCHILRLESLQDDLNAYLGRHIKLPHRNRSGGSDWRSMYTDELAEIVRRIHSADVGAFGYGFAR